MFDNLLTIIHDAPSSRGARYTMARIARASSQDQGDLPERRAAWLFINAQLAILDEYEARELPPHKRHSIITATRWLKVSAEYSTDGIWGFDGCPVYIDAEDDGLDPLPVPASLKDEIKDWNAEFNRRGCSMAPEDDISLWGQAHDARGLALTRQIRHALQTASPGMQPWTVVFDSMSGDTVQDKSAAAAHADATDARVARLQETARSLAASRKAQHPGAAGLADAGEPGWRFGLPPQTTPGLVCVQDMESMHLAMARFREHLPTWQALVAAAGPARSEEDLILRSRDAWAQYLRAQAAVIADWSGRTRHSCPLPLRDSMPADVLQASRYLKVMADESSDGLWTWEGFPADPADLPLRPGTRKTLSDWMDLYERARLWDTPERRPFVLDKAMFDRLGLAATRAIRQDLPGWRVDYRQLSGGFPSKRETPTGKS